MSTSADVLKIDNLVMVRGTKAVVHGIKLEVKPGMVTALMGPNGAGKTSTVLGLSGVVEPAFGDIWLDGRNLKGLESDEIRRHGIATVPEGHQVLRELTVKENLQVAGGGLSSSALNQSIERVLELFPELKTRLNQAAGDLSGGQQQMVSISQALVVSPRYLLIEQFTQLALGLSTHVYVMSRGRVSYDGGPDNLKSDPDILHRAYFPISDREAVGLA